MHFNPYGGMAAQVAADLVNAGDGLSPETVTGILDTRGYLPVPEVGPDEAAHLAAWAGRLRPVFDTEDLQFRVAAVNELLTAAASVPYISQHDGRAPHLHFAHERAPVVERLRAYTAAGLAHALCQDPGRIGRCASPGCSVVYVDTSRNGRRRFCSTRCATRVHVAHHRSRHRVG